MRLFRAARAAPIALLIALAACHGGGDAVSVDHAWVRLAAVPGRPAAAYLTIHGGKAGARLIAIDSPAAGASELHQSMTAGENMASMRRIDGLDVPAGGVLVFAPGGYHVMLFGVGAQAEPGGQMPLIARFAKGDPARVEAKLVAAGDPAPY